MPHDTRSRRLRPSKAQCQIEDSSIDIPSPTLASQETYQPMVAQKSGNDSQPGHVQIIHFDFHKYRPSTPGSESRPIKIEDSPEASLPSPIRSEKRSMLQEPLALHTSRLEVPAIQSGYQPSDARYVDREDPNGSSFMILLGGLVPSAVVTTIIASPKASTAFLHCFLAAESYWLRSRDHDIDPDAKFWEKLIARFNANLPGYQIDTWLTARIIATILCSQPYKTQVEQQLPQANDVILHLLSAIEDCRRMSQRRRRQQQSGSENVKTSIRHKAAKGDARTGILVRKPQTLEEDVRKVVLTTKPQTLEDRDKLIEALATIEHIKDPETGTSTAGHEVNSQDKRKRDHLKPYTASLDVPPTRDDSTRPDVRSNRPPGPEVMRRNPNKRFKKWGKNRPQGGYPYSSTREVKGNRRGAASSRYTVKDKGGLERRLRELERQVQGRR
ncbi:hypothetical protein F4823DRAFT_204620 [Ustulina deusta]|nr:hypothetical protein F4823DRAFT_204620 [Ustulina deusta]